MFGIKTVSKLTNLKFWTVAQWNQQQMDEYTKSVMVPNRQDLIF